MDLLRLGYEGSFGQYLGGGHRGAVASAFQGFYKVKIGNSDVHVLLKSPVFCSLVIK